MSQPESMDVRYFRLLEKYMSRLQSQILAASVIAIVPTVLLFGVLQRYYLEGIKTTGMKE